MAVAIIALGLTAAAAGAEPTPNGVPGSWSLVLNEEFSGTSLNTSLWTPGWQHGGGISGPVSGRCFSSNLVAESGGTLELQIENQAATCGGVHGEQAGGLVESNPSDGVPGHSGFAYSYGDVEWRVYLPGVAKSGCAGGTCIANWPGLWSDPTDNTGTPEIDTMEGLPNFIEEGGKKVEDKGSACFHFHPPFPENGNCAAGSYAGWHTFDADWEPSGVTYYFDGKKVGELTSTGNRSQSQYLIMDQMAPYGTDPLLDNQAMLVDYVRVWRPRRPISNAWAFQRPPGELDAFYDGTNNVMYDWFAHPGWSLAEFSPGSGYPSAAGYPSAFLRSNGELNAFYRGTTNEIYQLFSNTQWHVEALGCCSAGDPLAFERSSGELQVFFRGTDNGVYNDWYSGGKWNSQRLGGTSEMLGKPSGFERANGEIQVFFRGTDNGIYNLWYSGGHWSLQRLACCTAGNPVALERGNGEIDVLFRGTNNSIYVITYSGGTWKSPAELATEAAGNPSAFERVSGEVQMFYRARQTGAIWNGWLAPGATKWSFAERACCAAGDPSTFEAPDSTLRVFFRGTNSAIYDFFYSNGTWYSPEYVGGEAAEDPEY